MFSVFAVPLFFYIPVILIRTDGGVDSGAGHGQQNEDHGGGAAAERPRGAESRGGDADGHCQRSSAADPTDDSVDADGDSQMEDV
ncbi:uncharacterized protein BO66DRAFT_393415 [Aspergillus aculeatinus CBS 121060]|uniref:Uncharacterized protein n=1 Tax=Aspergillus aculeatinus CBS 121060 TaxID=1448322 RepID=A0ACD1H393_9EURO|nr:hypothetical protein BO66DRAFT_393415 [Aspergillus aculeatinus CBS 121060]RAH67964.1 hypothetical protein BO66DRAFT_393415 [Aspergillus aculeatinus CBS 121060]